MTRTTVQLQAHDVCNCTITAEIRPADDHIRFENFDIVMINIIIIVDVIFVITSGYIHEFWWESSVFSLSGGNR